jgi:hypothetical protein
VTDDEARFVASLAPAKHRIIVAVADLPPIGGKRVVVESFGISWILDSNTADSISGLLDLDGHRVCYAYCR